MIIGYARVSSTGQDLDGQIERLTGYGCERIFQEKISGKSRERPELDLLLSFARDGDTVVVCKLDRLARSLIDLLTIQKELASAGVKFKSLGEEVDTTSIQGALLIQVIGAIAEFERGLIKERTAAGRARAVAEGRTIGGPKPKLTPEQQNAVLNLIESGSTYAEIAKIFQVSKTTIYRVAQSNDSVTLTGEFQQELTL